MSVIPRLAFGAVAMVLMATGFAPSPAAAEEKPYRIVGGKVDFGTYNGFRRYHNSCHVCHGPDGLGSSFGPALVDTLKAMSKDDFVAVIIQGRESNVGGVQRVMPSFGTDENVALYLDDLYAYVKARSDGAIGRGRPDRLEKGE
jgi:methanol metabolism-related c-type cytochrome